MANNEGSHLGNVQKGGKNLNDLVLSMQKIGKKCVPIITALSYFALGVNCGVDFV